MEFQLADPDWPHCEYCDKRFKQDIQLDIHQPICAEKWLKLYERGSDEATRSN